MSDPAKEKAKAKWGDLNKELDKFRKLAESPDDREGFDLQKWLKLKIRLLNLKYEGLEDLPGPYDRKLIEWYSRLSEVDRFIEEVDGAFPGTGEPTPDGWKEIVSRIKDAKRAKERLEAFLE